MATPAMLQDSGQISVAPPRTQRVWVQAILLALTILTTTMVGMRYMVNFQQGRFPLASDADVFPFRWVYENLSHFGLGLPFSITILTILLTHEFGHYFACRSYGVRATLPYLLPAPSLSGTAGAVIRLKSRVTSRTALVAIGVIGPIAGFIVATISTIIGLALSRQVSVEPQKLVDFQSPLLFKILFAAFGSSFHIRLDAPLLWHPILIASWIGLLITSINLLPAGQLDGGHILYALSPRVHRIATYVVIAMLFVLGIKYWLGWLIWALLLCVPGMRHPSVKETAPLARRLFLLVPVSIAILILTATPQPFTNASLLDVLSHLRH
jgi:membrane-associated protease RseP (regulator of RpoE activity)